MTTQATDNRTIDLGDDPEQTVFRLNGKEFTCFPLDELEGINEMAEATDPPALNGEPFLEVVARRLLSRFGIKASNEKCSQWYQALHRVNEEQKGFFVESPASSASTGSAPSESAGDDSNPSKSGATGPADSSKRSRTRSKPKK